MSVLVAFAGLPDPRSGNARRHRLLDVLTIALTATICGAENRPDSEHITTDAEHGRIELRRHRVSHEVDWLLSSRRFPGEAAMPGLTTLAEVEAVVTRAGRTTTTRRLYLSSARLDAAAFAAAVRAHWRIENSLHRVLDVGFDEDRARNRRDHGPENLAILRKLALNVLRGARPDISIRRKRKRSGWSDDFARTILGQMRQPCGRTTDALTK